MPAKAGVQTIAARGGCFSLESRFRGNDSKGRRALMIDDLDREVSALASDVRGRLTASAPLAPFTWFRVGGPAQLLFQPADPDDLSYLLSRLPQEIPVTVIGLGSNLIIRDGGLPGLTVRLGGKSFATIETREDHMVAAGAASPDAAVAKTAAQAGIAGLEFFRGVPGAIGGALRMNAGAHGGETKDVLVSARGVDRAGASRAFTLEEMGFSYRHSSAPDDVIFTQAIFQGRRGAPTDILAEMERITAAREASQPIREKTGGSTFKNPPGAKAWKLIDEAGCRGLVVGDAEVSTMHCNFLINRGGATAADIEALGEEVRRRVRETSGITLEWEIKRIGQALVAPRAP
jgi:UDP-N-acetylmuramate dehydrogenase